MPRCRLRILVRRRASSVVVSVAPLARRLALLLAHGFGSGWRGQGRSSGQPVLRHGEAGTCGTLGVFHRWRRFWWLGLAESLTTWVCSPFGEGSSRAERLDRREPSRVVSFLAYPQGVGYCVENGSRSSCCDSGRWRCDLGRRRARGGPRGFGHGGSCRSCVAGRGDWSRRAAGGRAGGGGVNEEERPGFPYCGGLAGVLVQLVVVAVVVLVVVLVS